MIYKRLLASTLAAFASWNLFVSVSRTFPSIDTLSPILGVKFSTSVWHVNGIVDG